jgi:hypothetical protein
MDNILDQFEDLLLDAIRRSGQASYSRRASPQDVLIDLGSLARKVESIIEEEGASSRACRLLSQIYECMLNYRSAAIHLEQAMTIDGRKERKDLKRLARLRESHREWTACPLLPTELSKLGEFLSSSGANDPSIATNLDLTTKWLKANTLEDVNAVLEHLRTRGVTTDFQVLNNVVRG